MTQPLQPDDFLPFFKEIHGHLPFPWQARLLRQITEQGRWPEILDLPTGSGKTASLDIAVFHLALEADSRTRRNVERRAPIRIALVVDRRLVVDDAFERARKLSEKLSEALRRPTEAPPVTDRVAKALQLLAGPDAPPLLARRLRGGIPREENWARSPSQPTILCSTVDQVGSRLLFRGYGVSDRMKPVHAGLIGTDCLILLDEAHLSEPFRQTLGWVKHYQSDKWRRSSAHPDRDLPPLFAVAQLTATKRACDDGESGSARKESQPRSLFQLDDDDRAHHILAKRLGAAKPARLVELPKAKASSETEEEEDRKAGEKRRLDTLLDQVRKFAKDRNPATHQALGIVVNRVARARALFEAVRKAPELEAFECLLLIGSSRPVERDKLAEKLKPIKTGTDRSLEKPLIIIATQCIEAGVDIDLDGLITETAPIDALRQRFGRLNRNGRDFTPFAAIIGGKADAKDPLYGPATAETWKYLTAKPDKPARKGTEAEVDFGINTFNNRSDIPDIALSRADNAPILLPAHLDLLSQTSPIPAADPEVSLYLHGPRRDADSVTVIWRADIDPDPRLGEETRRLLLLVPPRSAEAIELPVWAVRRWLERRTLAELADIPAPAEEDATGSRRPAEPRRVFRWKGDDDRSAWIFPGELRPGDTVIVPARYGGVDEFGWNPDSEQPAQDVADKAAEPFDGRRFVVRVAPGLLQAEPDEEEAANAALAAAIAEAESTRDWLVMRRAVLPHCPPEIRARLERLDDARKKLVDIITDLYGRDDDDRPRGVVFLARFGLDIDDSDQRKEKSEEAFAADGANSTEDDLAGSLPGYALSLEQHSADVEAWAEMLARRAELPAPLIEDLKLAGYFHDAGKADSRFQAWLHSSDPLRADREDPGELATVLAKSARRLPTNARERSGLPDHWRHEALSVRLAPYLPRFAEAEDAELVLWLVGSHHGYGRPFFPHADPLDQVERQGLPRVLDIPETLPPGLGPQSLGFDWNGLDWPSLFERLKAKYGVWNLARIEAILRLADHRASEEAERAARRKRGRA
jgi:CRISPR-associated endonuclease/helicase Cas3